MTIPIRHGRTVIHAQSISQAADLARELSTTALASQCAVPSFALAVSNAAHTALDLVNASVPLVGRARITLGTALRAAEVRRLLGDELVKEIGYIANGADAFRHLGETDINNTLHLLRKALPSVSNHCVGELSTVLEDPLADRDPWASAAAVACWSTTRRSSSFGVTAEKSDPWSVWIRSSCW